jgi:hypothetical protein
MSRIATHTKYTISTRLIILGLLGSLILVSSSFFLAISFSFKSISGNILAAKNAHELRLREKTTLTSPYVADVTIGEAVTIEKEVDESLKQKK